MGLGKRLFVPQGAGDLFSEAAQHFKLDNNVNAEVGPNGTNNNLTFSSSTKVFGTHSAVFNGTNADLDTNRGIQDGQTFSAWVKHGNDNGRLMTAIGGFPNYDWFSVFMRTSGSTRNLGIYWVTTTGQYRYWETNYVNAPTSLFYHIAVTFTNTTTAPDAYINGTSLTVSSAGSGGTPAATFDWGDISFGKNYINGNTTRHTGNIDQIRIFDRVLDSTEIATLYNESP